jgi:hypothetical protein
MSIKKEIQIQAKNEIDAASIAQSMSEMSGAFSAKEWQQISKKLKDKTVQMRIRILLT